MLSRDLPSPPLTHFWAGARALHYWKMPEEIPSMLVVDGVYYPYLKKNPQQ